MANKVDQRFVLFKNDKYIKAQKADGSEISLFKVSATDKWEFAVAPEIGGSALQTEAQVDAKILAVVNTNIAQVQANLDAETIARNAADTSLQNQVNTVQADLGTEIQTRADAIGQVYTDFNANDALLTTIINTEVARASGQEADIRLEFAAADVILQSQIDAISGGGSGSLSALQAELDATQAGVGLNPDGTFIPFSTSSYMNVSTSIVSALESLDFALNAIDNNLGTEIDTRTAEIADLQDQINNTLSNVDPAALDSLTEVVASFQAADASLNGAITALATGLSADIATETAARIAADIVLQGNIDDLDGYAQVIRSDLDQEILDRVAAVSSEESARIAADSAMDARVDALESVVWFKEKFLIVNGQTSVTLAHIPESKSMTALVDRLGIHEGASEDYTISGSTMTFLNDLVSPGQSQLGAGDTVYVKYQYKV